MSSEQATTQEPDIGFKPRGLYIGGAWQDTADGRTFETINPSTGRKLGEVPYAGPVDVDRAVQAAKKAFLQWQERASSVRAGESCREARQERGCPHGAEESAGPRRDGRRSQEARPRSRSGDQRSGLIAPGCVRAERATRACQRSRTIAVRSSTGSMPTPLVSARQAPVKPRSAPPSGLRP